MKRMEGLGGWGGGGRGLGRWVGRKHEWVIKMGRVRRLENI